MKYYLLSSLLGVIFLRDSCCATLKAETVLKCDFETDACGFFNDDGHEAKWERKQMNLGGRTGTVMTVETGGNRKHQLARLMSPLLDGHWSNAEGCLSLELFTGGDGVTAFRVKQQDETGILHLLGVHTQVKQWRRYDLHVDVGDFVRFIMDASVNPELGKTLVAIDNVSFQIGECRD